MSYFEDIIFIFCENQQVQHNYVSRNRFLFFTYSFHQSLLSPQTSTCSPCSKGNICHIEWHCFYLPQVFPQFLFSSINCTSIFNHCCFVVPSFVSPYDSFPYQHKTLNFINMSCYLRRNSYTLCVVIFSGLMDEGLSLLTFTHKYSLAPWIDVSSRECYKKFT